MSLLQYYKNQFPVDLETIGYEFPSEIHLNESVHQTIDLNTRFFGGLEWENYTDDISQIDTANVKYFCVCLFMIVSIDENYFSHFKPKYIPFRRISNYPKFGWIGLGLHFEKPCLLINKPNINGVDFENITDSEINEFLNFYFANANFLNIDQSEFLESMINDEDFQCTSGIGIRILYFIQRVLLNREN